MRVLFIAFEFPPLGGIGVQRSLKFAKYLPEHGVEPVVVTTDESSFQVAVGGARIEPSLLTEIPEGVRVERVPCPGPLPVRGGRIGGWLRQFRTVTDSVAKMWRPNLIAAVDRLVAETRPQAVYVSVPPFSMAPLAHEVASRHGLPLFLDFRDPWSGWGSAPHPTRLHYHLNWLVEERCMQAARGMATVTPQLRADFLRDHPLVEARKMSVITNGFDAELRPEPLRGRTRAAGDPFVFGYVGTFYYRPETHEAIMSPWWSRRPHRWLQYARRREDWFYRTPWFLFRMLTHLFERRPELRSQIKVRFVGRPEAWLEAQVREFGLQDAVEHLGYLGFEDCQTFQRQCDCLFVTATKILGGADYVLAGKIFEYLAAKRPILGLVTEGAQRDFLEHCGVATVCDPDDPAAGSRRLEELIEGRLQFVPDLSFLASYHRRATAGQMAAALRRCAGKS